SRKLDAVYVTRPVSIAYLTGFHAEPFERLMALAIRREEAILVVPALEGESARSHATNAQVVSWRDGEDPYALVTRALGESTEVGVEKDHLTLHAAEVITSRTGASELVDIGPEIRRLRLTKRDEEVERLVRAAALTAAGGEAVIPRPRSRQTEMGLVLVVGSSSGELVGTLAFGTLVQSGPNS